jgi:hypothetical protein
VVRDPWRLEHPRRSLPICRFVITDKNDSDSNPDSAEIPYR